MSREQRLQAQILELQSRWDLLSQKLRGLEEQNDRETRYEEQWRMAPIISDLKTERQQVEAELTRLEEEHQIKNPLPPGQIRQERIWSSETHREGGGQESPATLGRARVKKLVDTTSLPQTLGASALTPTPTPTQEPADEGRSLFPSPSGRRWPAGPDEG